MFESLSFISKRIIYVKSLLENVLLDNMEGEKVEQSET